jgi:hypothetical protein
MLKTHTTFFRERVIWILLFSFMFSLDLAAKDDGLSRTPPMGWNSWK